MGVSRFIHGDGLDSNATVIPSSVKPSNVAPEILPENRGSSALTHSGAYTGTNDTTYDVRVLSVSADAASSQVTDIEFRGPDARSREALVVEKVSSSAPVGEYELHCIDPGKEDQLAVSDHIFESEGVRFKANENLSAVAGTSGNFLRIAVYAVAPDYTALNLSAAATYPRPSDTLLTPLIADDFSPFTSDRFIADLSKDSVFPQTFTYPYYPNSQQGPLIPYVNSEDNYPFDNVTGLDPITGTFLPRIHTPRFIIGYPVSAGSSLTEVMEKVFFDRIYTEYAKDAGDGSGDILFGIKAAPRSANSSNAQADLIKGMIPYPIIGGYLVHVYQLNPADPAGTHALDFFYTRFPVADSSGAITWLPITTWGEFSYALDQHDSKGLYYTGQTSPILSGDLRYPPILLDSSDVAQPRRKRFSAWENSDIVHRTGGVVTPPKFTGTQLVKLDSFRTTNREVIRDEELNIICNEVVEGRAIFDVIAPASSALASAPQGLGPQMIARMREGEDLLTVLQSMSAGFANNFGLTFTIPPFAQTTDTSTPTTSELPRTNYEVTLVKDSPDNPRDLQVCVQHMHVGPGASKLVSVSAVWTKFTSGGCEACDDYIPAGYEDSCLGAGVGNTGSNAGPKEVLDIAYTVNGEEIIPIPIIRSPVLAPTPYMVEKQEWVSTSPATVLADIDAAIAEYEALAIQVKIIDRASVAPEFRRDPNAPSYTILLGGDEVSGDTIYPSTAIDPFCDTLTSGCTAITTHADDGKSYSSWGTRVDFGITRTASLEAGAVNIWALKTKQFFESIPGGAVGPFQRNDTILENYSQMFSHFDTTPYMGSRWGAGNPVLSAASKFETYNQSWADTGYDYYVPLSTGRNRLFDKHLFFFKYAFLDKLSNLSGVSTYSIVQLRTELDQLISDWLDFTHDPGEYMELNYSSRAGYTDLIKWLYRLPQTGEVLGDAKLQTRGAFLGQSLPFAYAQGGAGAAKWRISVTYRYTSTAFNTVWSPTPPPELLNPSAYLESSSGMNTTTTTVLLRSGSMTESELVTEVNALYNATINHASETTTFQPGFDLVRSAWSETYVLESYNYVRIQDLDSGLSDKIQTRISALLGAAVGNPAIPPSDWEAVHMGGLRVGRTPSQSVNGLHYLGEGVYTTLGAQSGIPYQSGSRSFAMDRAMDQVFWLRLLKLITKCGFFWDVTNALNACPLKRDMTNTVGCTSSTTVCEHPVLNEDYWRVTVDDSALESTESYPPAYNNIATYYDLLKHRFSFLIATHCPEKLEYGDTISMKFIPPGADDSGAEVPTYAIGEQVLIRCRAGRKVALSSGSSGLDIATWRFSPPVGSGLPIRDLRLLNRLDTSVTIPSSEMFDLFRGTMLPEQRFKLGDKFLWSLSGGTFLVIRSDGATYGPANLTNQKAEFFAGDGVKFGFSFNSRTPFVVGDRWLVNLHQDNAGTNARSWDTGLGWSPETNTAEILEYDLGTPTSINAAVVLSNITTSGTIILEAKNTADAWGAPPFQQTLTVNPAIYDGFNEPPAIYLDLVGTTAYQQWRIRCTDATRSELRVKIFKLFSNSVGIISLAQDHDILVPMRLTTNPFDLENKTTFQGVGGQIDANYDMLSEASFKDLWSLFIQSRRANNRPFVWIPNYNTLDNVFLCTFTTSGLGFVNRAAFFKDNWYYSDIPVSLVLHNE